MTRTLGRIALGAFIGLVAACTALVCLIFFTEALLYPRGFRYDDMTLAYLSQGLLMVAPIVGGWWAWVRR